MAGDWIKMSTDLRTHPKVRRMASALKADKLRVVGALHAVWCLFDAHSTDGSLDGYDLAALDDEIGWKGFARALLAVEWLESDEESGGVRLPRYDSHNGASAKRRAMESERKRLARLEEEAVKAAAKADAARTPVPILSASDADHSGTREEKRREEKNKDLPQAAAGVDPATPGHEPDPPLPPPLSKALVERATEIAVVLRKAGAKLTSSDPRVLDWATRGISDAQLLTATDKAIEARHRKGDPTPINAGFIDALLADVIAERPTYDLEALARATA